MSTPFDSECDTAREEKLNLAGSHITNNREYHDVTDATY